MPIFMVTVVTDFENFSTECLDRKFFTTAVFVVALKGFITYCESGKYGLFGNGGLIMFDVSSVTFKVSIC
jgi:hypothetical protein